MAFDINALHPNKSNLTWHGQDILKALSPPPDGPGTVIDHSILPSLPIFESGLEDMEGVLLAANRENTICRLRKMVHRLWLANE